MFFLPGYTGLNRKDKDMRNLEDLIKTRSGEVARRDKTTNPAIRAAAIRNIQSLNIQIARRRAAFGR